MLHQPATLKCQRVRRSAEHVPTLSALGDLPVGPTCADNIAGRLRVRLLHFAFPGPQRSTLEKHCSSSPTSYSGVVFVSYTATGSSSNGLAVMMRAGKQ